MNWNIASHTTLVVFELARQNLSMLYRIALWVYLSAPRKRQQKSHCAVRHDNDPVSREDLRSSGFSENKGLGQGVLSLAGP